MQLIRIGNLIRGPPTERESAPRLIVDLAESTGRPQPTSAKKPFVRRETTLASGEQAFGLPIYTEPATKRELLNLPVLRVGYSPRVERTVEVSLQGKKYVVRAPDYLYLTSPLRDVDIQFQLSPSIDVAQDAAYFPSTTEGVKGFYPASDSVEFQNGIKLKFDPQNGAVRAISGPGTPSTEFRHLAYQDGPLSAQALPDPNLNPRPPPNARRLMILREARGDIIPSSSRSNVRQVDRARRSSPLVEIRNSEDDGSVTVLRDEHGKLTLK
jgi:hypothetical protein